MLYPKAYVLQWHYYERKVRYVQALKYRYLANVIVGMITSSQITCPSNPQLIAHKSPILSYRKQCI